MFNSGVLRTLTVRKRQAKVYLHANLKAEIV
jgi:hypothetical protein